MSVTFIAILAPTEMEEAECYFCDSGVINPKCPVCSGTGIMDKEVSTLPEINLANNNAESLLMLVSPEKLDVNDLCGEWEIEDLPIVRRTLIRLLNSEKDRAYEIEEAKNTRAPTKVVINDGDKYIQPGMRIISAGRTDEYLVRRLNQLLELVVKAQEIQSPIAWN